ncbi:MAG: hypothetical protein MJ171_01710 [Clostridia bacterium]|nr:hypothetical protein [Clostridia bacterium]
MKSLKKILVLCLILAMVFAMAACGKKDEPKGDVEYPTKEIRLLVPYKAGGNSDIQSRKLAEIIDKYNLANGYQVVVSNINGSATQECFNAMMKADPDGYTLINQHNAILTQPAFGNVTFDMEDVAAVCEVMEQPFMIFADGDAPYSTTQELVDYCKAHPDEKITFGVPGVGSSGQMGIEIYLDQLGIRDNMKFIIYTSGGESLTGHLGKECVIHGGFASDGMRYVETGDLKVLAVSGQTRVAALPNTECFGELGFKTDYMTYQGIWATKGTPEEVINKIADIFKAACATPEWQQYCDEQGCINVYAGPQEWHDLMADLNVVIVDLVKRLGLAG